MWFETKITKFYCMKVVTCLWRVRLTCLIKLSFFIGFIHFWLLIFILIYSQKKQNIDMRKELPKLSTWGRTLLANLVSTSLFRWQERDTDAKQIFSRTSQVRVCWRLTEILFMRQICQPTTAEGLKYQHHLIMLQKLGRSLCQRNLIADFSYCFIRLSLKSSIFLKKQFEILY